MSNEIAAFLYLEARLVDEHRYKEWLSLWEESGTLYWVPCNDDDIDPRARYPSSMMITTEWSNA